jgi:glutaconyl-CoA/methylmalonyl-CoA decarboxylase subunit gamma
MRRYRLEIRGREFVIDVDDLAANRFAVTVGDESYEVELAGDEDLSEATITPAFAPARAAGTSDAAPADRGIAPATRKASTPTAAVVAPRKPAAGGSVGTLAAPMPGVVLEVNVKPGDTVVRGQQIAILEAMKMQNSIKSPRAGTIAEVCVAAGQAVGHGDALIRFQEG